MIFFILSHIGRLVPKALAGGAILKDIGTANPGVQNMWTTICSAVPFCNKGTTAPVYFLGDARTGALGRITFFIFEIIGGIAVAALMYAGFLLITGRGSDEKFNEGKKIAAYALLGLVLAILADLILNYVITVINAVAR